MSKLLFLPVVISIGILYLSRTGYSDEMPSSGTGANKNGSPDVISYPTDIVQLIENIRKQNELHLSSLQHSFAGFPQIPLGDNENWEGAARAFASIDDSRIHQIAQIFPENPNSPNIETRFASNNNDSTGGNGGGGKFYSVSTSSLAGSETVNGKTKNFRESTSTVNDNGKITKQVARYP